MESVYGPSKLSAIMFCPPAMLAKMPGHTAVVGRGVGWQISA